MRLIDADTLIEELNNSHFPGASYVDAGISIAIGKVLDAPTIEPERKPGHWILGGYDDMYYVCDQCGYRRSDYYAKPKAKYCENCGADMRGEQDG